jgi:hypothetical protein
VQITSTDLSTVYATVLTIPHDLEPDEKVPNTTFVYYPAVRASRARSAPGSRPTRSGRPATTSFMKSRAPDSSPASE